MPGTSVSSSHGQGQGNVRPRTTSTLSNVSMSPPREILGVSTSRPSLVVSSRPALPVLLSTAVSSSSYLASGLQDVAGLSRSPSSVMIVLPSQRQRDWVLSMSVRRASSTIGGVSGGAGGAGALGPIGVSASPTEVGTR
ncbi:hypothetical protein K435DRAFT_55679 [Dendrothele bispora CBS 962.96]|uniref:Uncharacterized protein n=1 Tax=Dendrothele bispora (strain CBS 962.96) TaxID=1314807 RepID=A0A4S8KRP8_DENBC|nr:hypothetical protein K435DRAFT_55679 [Dendrothele bispora CBS 962.96]